MEDFKVLEQFLCDCKKQYEVELLSVDWVDSIKANALGNRLTAQINLLGTILNLPSILTELKKQFDANELRTIKLREDSEDPLNLEGV